MQEGTAEVFWGNQATTSLIVGSAGSPYPNGLILGKTYFWRIDDIGVDGSILHKGKVWRFTVSP